MLQLTRRCGTKRGEAVYDGPLRLDGRRNVDLDGSRSLGCRPAADDDQQDVQQVMVRNGCSKERNNMSSRSMNSPTLRKVVLAAAVAMLAAVISVPAGVIDKPLSKAELKDLIANARTPAAHERIAQHFEAEAVKYEADAKVHGEEASNYAAHPSSPANGQGRVYSTEMQSHCSNLESKLKEAAHEARELAAAHRGMAREATK